MLHIEQCPKSQFSSCFKELTLFRIQTLLNWITLPTSQIQLFKKKSLSFSNDTCRHCIYRVVPDSNNDRPLSCASSSFFMQALQVLCTKTALILQFCHKWCYRHRLNLYPRRLLFLNSWCDLLKKQYWVRFPTRQRNCRQSTSFCEILCISFHFSNVSVPSASNATFNLALGFSSDCRPSLQVVLFYPLIANAISEPAPDSCLKPHNSFISITLHLYALFYSHEPVPDNSSNNY